MTKRIPIAAAKRIAEEHGLSQVLIIGWDGLRAHVVTYGKTKKDCVRAAQAQDFWTGRIKEFSFRGPGENPLTGAIAVLKSEAQASTTGSPCSPRGRRPKPG